MTDLLAAIDIGTNSMHLVVARPAEAGGFEVVTTHKEVVRLGQGSGDMKQLAHNAIERGIDCLVRMTDTARSLGATVFAVATSAVREAENRKEFISRARHEAGIEVEVISGFEEARLIHLGMLRAVPVFDRRMMGFDIGGGSTEIVVGEGADLLAARSFRLGAIRLTERFFADGTIDDPDDVERCREYIRQTLAGIRVEFVGHQPEVLVASSGTAANLVEMALAERNEKPTTLNGASITSEELSSVVERILTTPVAKRAKLAGLDAKRVDIIVGGALLAEQIVAMSGLDRLTYSDFALREGVIVDRMPGEGADHLRNLRATNVARLGRQLDPDYVHAEHSTSLALALFDRLRSVHDLGDADRELLQMAGLLHNVGLFLSHSGHHKHSYYVIRNSEQLTGFNDAEIELIAQIARYHRKSHPKSKHDYFDALSSEDQRRVRVLAGILRIGIGLDRRHTAGVRSVSVLIDDDIDIVPVPSDSTTDLSVEVHGASARADLLAAALGTTVTISEPPRTEAGV